MAWWDIRPDLAPEHGPHLAASENLGSGAKAARPTGKDKGYYYDSTIGKVIYYNARTKHWYLADGTPVAD